MPRSTKYQYYLYSSCVCAYMWRIIKIIIKMAMIRVSLLINIGVNYRFSFAVILRSNELKSKDLNYDRRELRGNNSLKRI